MTSAYHCGNCPHATRLELDSPRNPHVCACALQDGKRMPSKEDGGWTFILGCLSHPLTQAALREEGAKQERERIVKILESWNPFQTTFGEVMESLCKQREGAPVTPQPQQQELPTHKCFTLCSPACNLCKDASCRCYHCIRTSRPAPSPDCMKCTKAADGYCLGKEEGATQAREKLFEAIRAERDPHLDYVDWDSIEAAYNRTGGDER